MKPAPIVLTIPETARVLAVSEATVRRLVRDGILPKIDLGGARTVHIPIAAVEAHVAGAQAAVEAQQARLRAVAS